MNAATIMVVEDDKALRLALSDTLELAGFRTVTAENGDAALVQLGRLMPDLIVSDLQMPGMDGHALLKRVRDLSAEVPMVMMTAHGDVASAVQAMRDGATDYVQKPFAPERFLALVQRYLPEPQSRSEEPIASDERSAALLRIAERVAKSEATVMLSGPSGSGKEVLARYIHRHSLRSDGPFIAINCAAIPDNMLEATLFGYEKGAFTGAVAAMPGKFEQAEAGTLFLDEVGEMELGLQAKLLRVLQEREVERLGGRRLITLNVRVLAATNRDLLADVKAGRFREDLYYRLNVFPLRALALKERPGDILALANAALAREAQRRGQDRPSLSAEACARLLAHDWPGNVRELENVMQRAMILGSGTQIGAELLHFDLGSSPDFSAVSASLGSSSPEPVTLLDESVRAREMELIMSTLRDCAGNRTQVSEKLGISPRTLRYKLARLRAAGIPVPE